MVGDAGPPFDLTSVGLADIPSLSLRPFQSLDELLAAVAPYCVRPASAFRGEALLDQESKTFWKYFPVLFVPVDQQTELFARHWIQSNDPELRWDGIRVLRWLKSDANAQLLKTAAQLPSTSDANEVT